MLIKPTLKTWRAWVALYPYAVFVVLVVAALFNTDWYGQIASGAITLFIGFLPIKSGKRARLLEHLKEEPGTVVMYESPHRIAKTLSDLAAVFAPRQAVLGRELTKIYEEFERGDIAGLAEVYRTKKPRGEYVIVIAGKVG